MPHCSRLSDTVILGRFGTNCAVCGYPEHHKVNLPTTTPRSLQKESPVQSTASESGSAISLARTHCSARHSRAEVQQCVPLTPSLCRCLWACGRVGVFSVFRELSCCVWVNRVQIHTTPPDEPAPTRSTRQSSTKRNGSKPKKVSKDWLTLHWPMERQLSAKNYDVISIISSRTELKCRWD